MSQTETVTEKERLESELNSTYTEINRLRSELKAANQALDVSNKQVNYELVEKEGLRGRIKGLEDALCMAIKSFKD